MILECIGMILWEPISILKFLLTLKCKSQVSINLQSSSFFGSWMRHLNSRLPGTCLGDRDLFVLVQTAIHIEKSPDHKEIARSASCIHFSQFCKSIERHGREVDAYCYSYNSPICWIELRAIFRVYCFHVLIPKIVCTSIKHAKTHSPIHSTTQDTTHAAHTTTADGLVLYCIAYDHMWFAFENSIIHLKS